MAKKKFDPSLVSSLVQRGAAEARQAATSSPSHASPPERTPLRKLEKKYLSLKITEELHDALYEYQLQYRKSNPQKAGLHPGIGMAVERLLREALSLQPL